MPEEITTFCSKCGIALTADINFCPKCGTPTPSYYSHSGSSHVDPTAIAGSADAIQREVPSDYGSPPYGTPDKSAYDPFNPYGTIQPPPPPPPPPPRRARSSLIVSIISGIVVSILILGIVGTFALLAQKGGNTLVGSPSPSRTVTNQTVPQSCGGAFSDEFNGSLHSGWSWINPSGQATHNITAQGFLTITTPGNSDLNSTTNTNAPRLLQPIRDNFTVETLVELPQNQQAGFQAAGILIWQDENNFIRVDRYLYSIDFEQVVNGVFSHNAPQSLASSTIMGSQFELQIQRNGDSFTAFWREPSQSWQYINMINLHLQNIMIGLDLIGQGAPSTTANYDYFRVLCV